MGQVSSITLSKLPKCEVVITKSGKKVVVLPFEENFITEHETYGVQLPIWVNDKTLTIRSPKGVNVEHLKTHEYNGEKSLPAIAFLQVSSNTSTPEQTSTPIAADDLPF